MQFLQNRTNVLKVLLLHLNLWYIIISNGQSIESLRGDNMNYKDEIIKMLNQIDNEKFLHYLYVLLKEMISKGVSD